MSVPGTGMVVNKKKEISLRQTIIKTQMTHLLVLFQYLPCTNQSMFSTKYRDVNEMPAGDNTPGDV